MIKLYINNKEVFVVANISVLEACQDIGIEIPRFCFHQRLSVAGNCRMCLVELERAPKPVASCTFPVSSNMRIFTESPLVKKARENILEFLLINHPLDCPICDQGGECDLQDQVLLFGTDKTRDFEFKRNVEDKNCGPLIKTIMTRCIHCTRCVRFLVDIAGADSLGTTHRGKKSEIGGYVSKALKSELSGNIVDLCPVGALTSKVYAFVARPWEIQTTETVDLSDGFGSNIRVDFKDSELVRILPLYKEDLNEEWISDKVRFNFDALKIQRLVTPFIKTEEGTRKNLSLESSFFLLNRNLHDTMLSFSLISDTNSDLITLQGIKALAQILGIRNVGFSKKYLVNADFQENFCFNKKLKKIESIDNCFLVGTNPRFEATAVNLRLKSRFKTGFLKIHSVGVPANLSYKTFLEGVTPTTLIDIAEGKDNLCKELRVSQKPAVILGGNVSERFDFFGLEKILVSAQKYLVFSTLSRNPICFLIPEANLSGGLFLGLNWRSFVRKQDIVFFTGTSKEEYDNKRLKNRSIILSSHNGQLPSEAWLVLPILTFFETSGCFMNSLGLIKKTPKILAGPILARSRAKIWLNLLFSGSLPTQKTPLTPWLVKIGGVQKCESSYIFLIRERICGKSLISRSPFLPGITDYYLSGTFSKYSINMANCSHVFRKFYKNFISVN